MERFSIEEFTDQSQWVVQLRSFLAEIQRAKYILKNSQLFYVILGVFYRVVYRVLGNYGGIWRIDHKFNEEAKAC